MYSANDAIATIQIGISTSPGHLRKVQVLVKAHFEAFASPRVTVGLLQGLPLLVRFAAAPPCMSLLSLQVSLYTPDRQKVVASRPLRGRYMACHVRWSENRHSLSQPLHSFVLAPHTINNFILQSRTWAKPDAQHAFSRPCSSLSPLSSVCS